MKKASLNFLLLSICAVFLTTLFYPAVSSAKTCDQWVAKVTSVQGTVEVKKAGETQWQAAKLNDTYCAGDVIRVAENSRADIALVNQPVLRLDQNTTITLGGVEEKRGALVKLASGAGLMLALENWDIQIDSLTKVMRYVEHFNSPWFQ